MTKKAIILSVTITIILSVLCVIAFYAIPFVKANSLLISANKAEISNEFDDETYISAKNYEKLRIIDRALNEDEYVQLKTGKKYRFMNLKNVNLICSVKATVNLFDEAKPTYSFEKNIIISFSYTNHKWIVTNVTEN